jgi:hypothetical protein
LHTPLLQK